MTADGMPVLPGPQDGRARAREGPEAVRELRKGCDRCGARRRDGKPCQAPAVPELLVCRRHGGATLAAQIVSARSQLQLRVFRTEQEWLGARGTPGEDSALDRYGAARSDLNGFERRVRYMQRLAYLAELRRLAITDAPEAGTGTPDAGNLDVKIPRSGLASMIKDTDSQEASL